jgi:alginate O-acetyltransferase complex protein AlgI
MDSGLFTDPLAGVSCGVNRPSRVIARSPPVVIPYPAISAGVLAASLACYGYWDLHLLPLLLVSIVLNWVLARCAHSGALRGVVAFGVVVTLVILGAFKYANFFADSLAALTPMQHEPFDIVLPLGISFFTFQKISYLLDIKRGVAPRYDLADYAFYVSFFPQLIAGPIVRHD